VTETSLSSALIRQTYKGDANMNNRSVCDKIISQQKVLATAAIEKLALFTNEQDKNL